MQHQNFERHVTVFTPYYRASTPERQAELDLCLRENISCAAIQRLVLLIDDGHVPPIESSKLEVRRIDARPTYLDWVTLSQQLPTGSVSLLANSDIYFDDTLELLHPTLQGPRRFLALSRYEKQGDRCTPHPNPHWSQDVWGFRVSSNLPAPMLKALDIPLGVPRCDNKVAYLFAIRGWTIHNPQDFVRSVHVHETQQRGYDKKTDQTILGGVAYVHPATALDAPSGLEFDVWARNVKQIKSVTLNGSLDNWLGDGADTGGAASAAAGKAATPFGMSPLAGTADSVPACQPVKHPAEIARAIAQGKAVFLSEPRFKVYRLGTRFMAIDSLSPSAAQWMEPCWSDEDRIPEHARALLTAFVPPVLDTPTVRLTDRPENADSCHFWQYPAATERQAFENHAAMNRGANIDDATRTVHTYLGVKLQ